MVLDWAGNLSSYIFKESILTENEENNCILQLLLEKWVHIKQYYGTQTFGRGTFGRRTFN